MNFSLSLPKIPRQIWIQAAGRGLYEAGYVLAQFYTPIVFVNKVGMSGTAVGFAIAMGSISSALGNFLAGALVDSPKFGRRGTLLFCAMASILASIAFGLSWNLPILIIANLFLGLSMSLYWAAADSAVMDSTQPEERHTSFALMGLIDNIGVGVGIFGGGLILSLGNVGRPVFYVSGLIFLLFLALIIGFVVETKPASLENSQALSGWAIAVKDKSLWLFLIVNTLFTTYIALVGTTLPLYFTNFLSQGNLSNSNDTSNLFTWAYIGLGTLLQIPIVQALNTFNYWRALMVSMGTWGLGFLVIWGIGGLPLLTTGSMITTYEIFGLGILAIATVSYKPFASALLSEIAPESLRGIYTAIAYQCWSIGYFIGPILGGWAIDQSPNIAHNSWLFVAISTILGLLMLPLFNHRLNGFKDSTDCSL
jgi:MFS family permease